MSQAIPSQFDGVSAVCKANVYFDAKVVSHTIVFPDGSKKTLGLIYPGSYNFNTGAAERMEVTAGTCTVRVKGETDWTSYCEGTSFEVPANSSFDIAVESGLMQYICSFLA